jgi:hypothetical protein
LYKNDAEILRKNFVLKKTTWKFSGKFLCKKIVVEILRKNLCAKKTL